MFALLHNKITRSPSTFCKKHLLFTMRMYMYILLNLYSNWRILNVNYVGKYRNNFHFLFVRVKLVPGIWCSKVNITICIFFPRDSSDLGFIKYIIYIRLLDPSFDTVYLKCKNQLIWAYMLTNLSNLITLFIYFFIFTDRYTFKLCYQSSLSLSYQLRSGEFPQVCPTPPRATASQELKPKTEQVLTNCIVINKFFFSERSVSIVNENFIENMLFISKTKT